MKVLYSLFYALIETYFNELKKTPVSLFDNNVVK